MELILGWVTPEVPSVRTHLCPAHPPAACRFERKAEPTQPLAFPEGTTPAAALDAVLRLPGVCSKRFLTTKVGAVLPLWVARAPSAASHLLLAALGGASWRLWPASSSSERCCGHDPAAFDAPPPRPIPPSPLLTQVDRSVTGLVAQQQCCGPLQLPVSDVAVMAQTHFGLTGAATAIGEQPIKVCWAALRAAVWRAALCAVRCCVPLRCSNSSPATHVAQQRINARVAAFPSLLQGLIDPAAMARLALGEALTNLVMARVTALRDVKASGGGCRTSRGCRLPPYAAWGGACWGVHAALGANLWWHSPRGGHCACFLLVTSSLGLCPVSLPHKLRPTHPRASCCRSQLDVRG